MAEDKSLTPEQQLLKLIEESNKAVRSPGTPQAAASTPKPAKVKKAPGVSVFKMPGQILGRISFAKRSAKRAKPVRRKLILSIAEINKGLIVLAACLLVYVVFDAAASARNLQRPPNFVPPKDMKVPFQKEAVEPLQESSFYLQKISSRDIFKEGARQEQPKSEGPAETAPAETAEAIQNLALVGISWSNNPDAIIEDKSHQRTFFVKRGQMIGDSVKVEAIFKDHVIVSYEDREYEIR